MRADGPKESAVLTGWVADGWAYALRRTPGAEHLLKGKLRPDKSSKGGPCNYRLASWIPQPDARYRWRIGQGCFWGTEDLLPVQGLLRVPVEELPLRLDELQPQAHCPDVTPPKLSKDPSEVLDDFQALFQAVESNVGLDMGGAGEIVRDYWEQIGYDPAKATGIGPPPAVEGAFADCLPLDSHRLLLFVLWRRQLRAWRIEWAVKRERGKRWVACSGKPVLRVAADLREPFLLYGSPSRLFLVTESGKLYGCRDADKGGRSMKLLWQDGRRPIRAVLSDAGSGKGFAFAPAGPGFAGPSVYFEIAEKVDPVPYDPVPLGQGKPGDPLKAVLAYARLLLADKKIVP